MPIQPAQTIQSLQATFAGDRKITPRQELHAAGTASDRSLEPRAASAFGFGRQATAWRVFEQVVFNTFAPATQQDAKSLHSDRLQYHEDQNRAAHIARRITGEFRQLQHGWHKPLTVRHIQLVAELVEAAEQRTGRTLEARATQILNAHERLRSVFIDRISTRDIRSLHEACTKLHAGPKQELRGNPTQHGGNVLKLKTEGERGFGLGRKVHQQDAWAKFHQVLFNTFAPKQNLRWEKPNLSSSQLAARKNVFDEACTAADDLARTIVQHLKGGDAAAPLLVEHVAQAHQWVSGNGDRPTADGWVGFLASGLRREPLADASSAPLDSATGVPQAARQPHREAPGTPAPLAPPDLQESMFLTPPDAAIQRRPSGTSLA